MLALVLTRRPSGPVSTIGVLTVLGDPTPLCFTCEDVVREPEAGRPSAEGKSATQIHADLSAWVATWKVGKETAIPTGTYSVIVTDSERFKRPLPLLEGVPGFEGIRLHTGNVSADTEGCILPGLTEDAGAVWSSREAFARVFARISTALLAGESVVLTVT